MTNINKTDNYSIDFEALMHFAEKSIKAIERPNRYPFRNRYQHSLRVLAWARRIQEVEGGDRETIDIAALCHDIGWDEHINHAIISRRLTESYLTSHSFTPEKLNKTLQAIEMHNSRHADEHLFCIESLIIMDADILDEVGALSVVWDAISASYNPEASYQSIYERIVEYHEHIISRRPLLRTKTGLEFYDDRVKVIEKFMEDFRYELGY